VLSRIFCLVSEADDLSLLPAIHEVGVTGFQVRAKSLGARALTDLTLAVLSAVPGAVVLVNDRLDVALAAGAGGVHLGASDLDVAAARRIAPGLVIGATCRSREDVVAAAAAGASYVGFGPVFASGSKTGLPDPLGVAAITPATGVLPVIVIGGLSASSSAAAVAAGAHGVAVIGAIWRHPDPVTAAKELVEAVG
jgi:thiamine-phosphate pyrophosphorylase